MTAHKNQKTKKEEAMEKIRSSRYFGELPQPKPSRRQTPEPATENRQHEVKPMKNIGTEREDFFTYLRNRTRVEREAHYIFRWLFHNPNKPVSNEVLVPAPNAREGIQIEEWVIKRPILKSCPKKDMVVIQMECKHENLRNPDHYRKPIGYSFPRPKVGERKHATINAILEAESQEVTYLDTKLLDWNANFVWLRQTFLIPTTSGLIRPSLPVRVLAKAEHCIIASLSLRAETAEAKKAFEMQWHMKALEMQWCMFEHLIQDGYRYKLIGYRSYYTSVFEIRGGGWGIRTYSDLEDLIDLDVKT